MSAKRHILVVDDERDLADLIAYNLRKAGYTTNVVGSGRAALDSIAQNSPDLVILDIMLPGLSGTEVAGRLRTNPATAGVPIIMVTAKTEEVDQVVGLTVGADDYVSKPFSMKVLLARVEAVLRRADRKSTAEARSLSLGPININNDTHEAFADGEAMKLTLTEFRLLSALVQGAGRVLSRSSLMARAMGPGVTVTERTIDVHVTSIRKKLGRHAGIIKTVRGVGYRTTVGQDDGSRASAGTAIA